MVGPGAADSRVRKPVSSPIALINGAGKTTVVFFSTPSSARVCRFRSCKRQWVLHHGVGCVAECRGGACFTFGGNDFGSLLSLGLGLTGHRALHAVRQLDVLELHQGYLHTPFHGGDIEDLPDVWR